MKQQLIILFFLFGFCNAFSQITNFKEYSYTEFFKMIEEEKDTVFTLSNALITYDTKTDKRFGIKGINVYEEKDTTFVYKNDIVINKAIELNNVQFLTTTFRDDTDRITGGVLLDIHFKKNVIFKNVSTLTMRYCRFDNIFQIDARECDANKYVSDVFDAGVDIAYSNFTDFNHYIYCSEGTSKLSVNYENNNFKSSVFTDRFFFANSGISTLNFSDNYIEYEDATFVGLFETNFNFFENNTFITPYIQKNINGINVFHWDNNTYSSTVFVTPVTFSSNDNIGLDQFKNGISAYNGFMDYSLNVTNKYPIHVKDNRQALITKYLDSVRIYNEKAFNEEMSLKSQFYNHYKNRYNTQVANKVYIELKDLETERLKVEHELNRSFRSYFKWKVNQFLKLFSDYGTEPSKAIVFSMYVILLFALIYLLFPNSWDSHGRKRIMDRYAFFFTYMNKNAGMHEVYLDHQQEALLEFDDFKTIVEKQGKTVPKFFTATALPLYKWAVSGTKLSASLLKRVDIMKGTWNELPKNQRLLKSFLLITFFLMAILYDVIIKMLNALMLSINTFTTLGFGEIPIKGLPRYLAIIQGFIGWFMLTIFSVSLISQLLN